MPSVIHTLLLAEMISLAGLKDVHCEVPLPRMLLPSKVRLYKDVKIQCTIDKDEKRPKATEDWEDWGSENGGVLLGFD